MSFWQSVMDLVDEVEHMAPFYGGDFGLGLAPRNIYRYHQRPSFPRVKPALKSRSDDREQSSCISKYNTERAVSHTGKDGFQVCMDVQQFKPNELSVKVVDDSIIVEGKHEEHEDEHGYISRHFVRRYTMPKDYDSNKVTSSLSSDGILTVSIPKPVTDKANAKVVQIQQTGPAHLNVKENPQEKPGEPGAPGDKQQGNKK